MQFTVKSEENGITVRDFVKNHGVSAALLAKLKRDEQGIVLNGTRVTVRAVLHEGDTLTLAIEDSEPSEKLVPFACEVETVLETPDYLVVNKPPFMPTHQSHGHFTDTLANALFWRLGKEDPAFRPRFINRLDRNTSGAVLVARHALSAAALSAQMAKKEIGKVYLAVVKGTISAETVLKTGIRRREESIIFREVCEIGEGDLSITRVVPLLASNELSLVALYPQTGRTHQLRVHMAHLGTPILGDDLYGTPDERIARHALHAAVLSFFDTKGGGTVRVFADFAPDMKELILQEFGKEGLQVAREYCESCCC